jgi:hypothetical protein
VCAIVVLFIFLKNLYALLHLQRFKTYIWYQSEVIGFKGMPLLLGFSSFLIEQVYLGFDKPGFSGSSAVVILV